MNTYRFNLPTVLVRLQHSLWLPAVVFMTSLLFSVALWSALPAQLQPSVNTDYTTYYQPVAHHVLDGHGLIDPENAPAVRYPPGFPLLLAAVFAASSALHVSQDAGLLAFIFVCRAISSTLIFLIARSVWRPLPALAAALIWTTYPLDLWIALQRGSEAPFIAFLLAALAMFWNGIHRKRYAWADYLLCGLLVGIAMLIRPIAVGLGVLLGGIAWLAMPNTLVRTRVLVVTMILLGNTSAVLPWEIWVYAKTHRLCLLSTGGPGSVFDGLTYAVNPSKAYRTQRSVPDDVRAVQDAILKQGHSLETVGDIVRALAVQVHVRPIGVIGLFARKAVRSWYASDSGRLEAASMMLQVPYLLLGAWGLRRAWQRGGGVRQMAVTHGIIIVYFWFMTISALSILRYMMPIMGLFCIAMPAIWSGEATDYGKRALIVMRAPRRTRAAVTVVVPGRAS